MGTYLKSGDRQISTNSSQAQYGLLSAWITRVPHRRKLFGVGEKTK